ncbi:hypothetical protein [Bacillus sp. T33-2]|nr:hypothetical protein [Bacillus sp. T33-2]
MSFNKEKKVDLMEYERKVLDDTNPKNNDSNKGRLPDQQNRLKDKENLRK